MDGVVGGVAVMRAVAMMALMLCACAETGQAPVSVPLWLAGADVSGDVPAGGGTTVQVERAELAFGPLYLCAGTSAGDLCETARLEWLDSAVVDLTVAEPAEAGRLDGATGTVRSWMYDLGISSQLTRSNPFVLSAARELGGASFVLEGVAVIEGIEVPFEVNVAVQQTDETELGVPVVRKSSSDVFFHDVSESEAGLVVRFDLAAWLRSTDFSSLLERGSCELDGAPTVCDGAVEQRCDGPLLTASRDCAQLGQACEPGSGCVERVRIEDNTEIFRALRNGLVSGSRPEFEWLDGPTP